MTQHFIGFPRETFEFLTDLAGNNSREWFTINRQRYEHYWLKPALDFVEAVEEAAAELSPPHIAQARVNGSVRRIFRDTRFSKDKTPYNPRMHLVFWTGDHPNRSPAIHMVLSAKHFGYGAGQWALNPDQLQSYRNAICNDKSRTKLLNILKTTKEIGCELDKETLKRIPTGFDIEDTYAYLIKRKSLVTRTLQDIHAPAQLQNNDCIEYCANLMIKLAPVNAWLIENT